MNMGYADPAKKLSAKPQLAANNVDLRAYYNCEAGSGQPAEQMRWSQGFWTDAALLVKPTGYFRMSPTTLSGTAEMVLQNVPFCPLPISYPYDDCAYWRELCYPLASKDEYTQQDCIDNDFAGCRIEPECLFSPAVFNITVGLQGSCSKKYTSGTTK